VVGVVSPVVVGACWSWSADEVDALVGVEEYVGGGPAVDEAHDAAPGSVHEAAGGVQDRPAQRLGSGVGPGAGEAQELEPAQQVGGEGEGHHPRRVGVEVREREPAQPGVLQPLDVLFDMRVGSHGGVEVAGVSGLVGVEAPVAELEGGEQAALGAGVQGFAAHDQAGPRRQLVVFDQTGELGDRGVVGAGFAVSVQGGEPHLGDAFGVEDRCCDLGVRACGDVEPDVAGPARGQEPLGAASGVGSHYDVAFDRHGVVAGSVATADRGGELADCLVQDGDVIGDGVRPSVARPQQASEGLAGRVSEAEHRVEPEPALVRGRGLVLASNTCRIPYQRGSSAHADQSPQ